MLTQSLGPSPANPRTATRGAMPRRSRDWRAWPWLDRSGRFSALKAVVLGAVLLPGASLAAQWVAGVLGAEPLKAVLQGTGLWALRLLLVALAVTPFRRVLGWQQVVLLRRMLGLAALGYAVAHLLLFVGYQGFSLPVAAAEIVKRFYLTLGFMALLGLGALGWTSTDGWMRRLGRDWKRLHRLVFPIAVLGILHFFLQSKAGVSEAVVAAGCFAWLLLWRALPVRWQGNGLALLALAPLAALGAALLEYAWYALATAIPAGRVLLANLDLGLDFGFSPRPAIWVGIAALGLALAAVARRLMPGPAGARA
ncbi:sulfite oxidase heme-binding subunit YedZ [Siccirubricoccus sp. G192]|uniref:sulfite oxidase heme-binding subunit YedZ n=1 Tax=Siccirubricoccus sp. G192 TaxID=2849651 RepID=UPI001C2C064D|nr:ferric reductase-like transmembrane domain-containing protein [Siccirubricoccus sp. G192]MBV1799165.1 ferric reductase-like transmembrane domain-containing protein [Siccirubricoccus sp. G192]